MLDRQNWLTNEAKHLLESLVEQREAAERLRQSHAWGHRMESENHARKWIELEAPDEEYPNLAAPVGPQEVVKGERTQSQLTRS